MKEVSQVQVSHTETETLLWCQHVVLACTKIHPFPLGVCALNSYSLFVTLPKC